MNGKGMVLSLALLCAARGAGAQPSQYAEMDSLLSELAASAQDMDDFLSGGLAKFRVKEDGPSQAMLDYQAKMAANTQASLERECATRFSLNNVVAQAIPSAGQSEIEEYHLCKAFVDKNPRMCDALSQYKWRTPLAGAAKHCHERRLMMLVAQGIRAGSPGGVQACVDWVTDSFPPVFTADARGKICAAIVGPGGTPTVCTTISSLAKEPFGPAGLRECQEVVGMVRGEEKACVFAGGKKPDERDRQSCLAAVAYRKAAAARSPEPCGNFAECRVMMGGDCGEYERKMKAAYCREIALEKYRATAPVVPPRPEPNKQSEYAEAFKKKKAELEGLITRLIAIRESSEPKSGAAYKTRAAKLDSLRIAVEKRMKEFDGGNSRQPAVKRKKQDEQ